MGRRRLDPVRNWWSKVEVTADCWLWTHGTDRDGYGKFAIGLGGSDQIHTRAHRFAYETFVGPIPHGLVVCHRCDNPPCVRPDHLFVATPRQNNDDKIAKGRHAVPWGTPLTRLKQTHCKRGHEFTLENTRIYIRNGRSQRRCKQCEAINSREWYWRQRGEVGTWRR